MKTCSITGCEKKPLARGWCSRHYYCWRRSGNPGDIRHEKHGLVGSPTYQNWVSMMSRCEWPANKKAYAKYHDRGIRVAPRWHNFMLFLNDMGERPSKKHSLDRIDGTKGYEPGNVRWATPKEQMENRVDNIYLTARGETHQVNVWAALLGIPRTTIMSRIRRGWNQEQALLLPALPAGRKLLIKNV